MEEIIPMFLSYGMKTLQRSFVIDLFLDCLLNAQERIERTPILRKERAIDFMRFIASQTPGVLKDISKKAPNFHVTSSTN